MIDSYQQRLDALFQLEFFGMKLGLENIHAVLDFLGHPERTFPSIHIAGTNGKGSVSSMLAAVHQAAGKKTGLYTSPHLIDFRERIKIDGAMISREEVTNFLERIWAKVEELRATFFEVTTALAFYHFAQHEVDVAIIETGLGGRLDATNVLEHPLASVVTSIGYDHMAQLGNTLEEIASEKAGILKKGTPAIVNCPPDVEYVFIDKAKKVGATIQFVREFALPSQYSDLQPSLSGEHQQHNMRTVLATLAAIAHRPTDDAIREGIAHVAELTGIRGRLEEVPSIKPAVRTFIDVGHNPEALEAVGRFFKAEGVRPIVVFGIMKDKDVRAAVNIIGSFAKRILAVQANTARALQSDVLASIAQELGVDSMEGGTVAEGISKAMDLSTRGDTVLISGSHYIVGEFLQNLNGNKEVIPSAVTKPKLRNTADFG